MRSFLVLSLYILPPFFQPAPSLKGTWEYAGGVYNGRYREAPGVYSVWRKYTTNRYADFSAGDGIKKRKHEAGTYVLQGDTCVETPIFSDSQWKIVNKPIHYLYTLRNDSLIQKGTWSPGVTVEEYWVKMK